VQQDDYRSAGAIRQAATFSHRRTYVIAVVSVFVACVVYSIVRYIVFAPKNLEHLPVFIVNKGVSMAAVICFGLAFAAQLRQLRRSRQLGSGAALTSPATPPTSTAPALWFRAGVFGAIWHIPMSLVVLRPAYFPEFFLPAVASETASGRMSFAGELIFCFGSLAAATLYLLTRSLFTALQRWQLSLAAMLCLQTHLLALGYSRGLNINASHAYLPPMWLLSAVVVFIGLIILLLTKPKAETPPQRAT